jgi:hypothetical protein
MTFTWDSDQPCYAWAAVDIALGVLMELFGWESTMARTLLVDAAANLDMPVVRAAEAILTLCGEEPPGRRAAHPPTSAKLRDRAEICAEVRSALSVRSPAPLP